MSDFLQKLWWKKRCGPAKGTDGLEGSSSISYGRVFLRLKSPQFGRWEFSYPRRAKFIEKWGNNIGGAKYTGPVDDWFRTNVTFKESCQQPWTHIKFSSFPQLADFLYAKFGIIKCR